MKRIGLIGCGNMGEAIVSGLLNAHGALPEEIIVSTKTKTRGDTLSFRYGIETTQDNAVVAKNATFLILAIKPNLYPAVIEEILSYLDSHKVVISITPSFSLETLEGMTHKRCSIVRAMPNTPAKVGYGMTGLAFTETTPLKIKQDVTALFACFGKTMEVREDSMKVVGSLSGSAPAFIELFMKAMVDVGVSYGMEPKDARTLVVQSFLGTAQLALSGDEPFEAMIDAVCSKGGSTIRGITSMKENGLESLIQTGIAKTTARFEEMAQENQTLNLKQK